MNESTDPTVGGIRHYADILNPLFWHDDFYRIDRMFEWAGTLVRAAGLKDNGWGSFNESLALLDDLNHRRELELPTEKFPRPGHTRARLAYLLLSRN